MNSQEQVELHHLERFMSALGGPRTCDLRLVTDDPPDAEFVREQGLIALEHTQLFRDEGERGSDERRQESLRARILRTARDRHSAAGGSVLWVKAHFSPHGALRASEVVRIANGVARAVTAHDPPARPNEWVKIEAYSSGGEHLPEEVPEAWMLQTEALSRPCWTCNASGYVAPIDVAYLQRKIHEKEAALPSYRARYVEAWLVLVADGFGMSSTFEIPDLPQSGLQTRFDAVYFFENFGGSVLRLDVPAAERGRITPIRPPVVKSTVVPDAE